MKKTALMIFAVTTSLTTASAYANWYEDIWLSELRMEGLQGGILDKQGQLLNVNQDILSSQKNIESLMHDVNNSMKGSYGWGTYQSHDYQSYGTGANDWTSVLHMAETNSGNGALGQNILNIAKQFPIDSHAYNQGISDPTNQQYYALQSQTLLATRAASELDYNKIQDQIAYQQMLQQQIEKTQDLKAAIDLNNRLEVESNLINLQILRQVALSNQEQAVSGQANVNVALSNAKFLIKK